MSVRRTLILVSALAVPCTARAQRPADSGRASGALATRAAARRGPDGRLEIEAVAVRRGVKVDGVLDDAVWRRAPAITGFVQSEPHEGAAASERTEVRIAYDAQTLFIAAYCHDRDPAGIVVNDIRKDFKEGDQDTFELIIDTFADRRNGYVFMTNPAGAKGDRQITNEGREVNASWDAVWTVRTRRVADGWTAEMAIPFRSLRFSREGGLWGINFSRRIRRRNEIDFWAPVPRAYTLDRVSLAGDLVGLATGRAGRDLRVKPYVEASTVRALGAPSFAKGVQVGADIKLGVTQGLTLDLTAHPDFAQVEADEQQVNLTQFSQFFPEKREFFLENSGLFYVGDAPRDNRVSAPSPDEDLIPFFSRRIGLTSDGTPIPIAGGARLTGNVAGLSVGAVDIQTQARDTSGAANYAVLRVKRNVLGHSDVGALFMSRAATSRSGDANRVWGVDATLRLPANFDWSSFALRSQAPAAGPGQYAWRTSLNREGDFTHLKAGVLTLGEGFQDDIGFYRRTGARKWLLDAGLRPRLAGLQRHGIREMHPHVTWNYYTDLSGHLIAKKLHTGYTFFLNDGGYTELSYNPEVETITDSLSLHSGGAPIAPGSYGWRYWQWRLTTDPSRALSVSLTAIAGGLWTGTQRTANASVTVAPSYHFRATLGVQRTAARLRLPAERFVKTLWTGRANYSFATNMFLDALLQYDGDQHLLNSNIRFNLIHHPLSDLFIVYNERRSVGIGGLPPDPTEPLTPAGRSVIIKFTQMMAF